jgi:hypothetical protein
MNLFRGHSADSRAAGWGRSGLSALKWNNLLARRSE